MSNAEGNGGTGDTLPANEDREEQKGSFIAKVSSLMTYPRSIDSNHWTTKYTKDNSTIDLFMPKPRHDIKTPEEDRLPELDIVRAIIEKPLFTKENGNQILRVEELVIHPKFKKESEFIYNESYIEIDKEGTIVASRFPEEIEIEDEVRLALNAAGLEIGLDFDEGYDSVMKTLNSLTLDDEVL